MAESGFGVEEEALASYQGRAGDLAARLGAVASGTLAPATATAGDAFTPLGAQAGLTSAFALLAGETTAAVTAAGEGLGGLAGAVGDSLGGYLRQDEDEAANLRAAERA
ncbi:hypothetical protein [Actinoalloteichus caeruleus]|uniref:hypothetical protein n=1 Tax=Actinoalloteichus cyanogriseus TaxID=2893586 RepID=UPI003AAD7A9B